jgi:Phytanoyl-CoA dioxygenase (PhyH)
MTAQRDVEALLPTDDEVALYRERGYYVSRRVLPDDVIDEAVRGAERHFAGERDFHLPVDEGFGDWKPGDPDTIRNSEFVALQNLQIRSLVMQPIIGRIASRLAGSDTIRLWDDQLVWKPPSPADGQGPVVGWHTDRAYWLTCTSEEMLTAWIPFHDCPEEMGPVIYVEGSHRWPETEGMRTFNAQDFEDAEERLLGRAAGARKRTVALEKGQMSFHHSRLIHGSDVNRGTFPRLSLALHMQDGSNRWRSYLNERGVQWEITNDRLARKNPDGTPDYTDPSVFPIMWPQAAHLDQG